MLKEKWNRILEGESKKENDYRSQKKKKSWICKKKNTWRWKKKENESIIERL